MEGRSEERKERSEERKGEFKKGLSGEEATRERVSEHDRVRRARREQLLKRVRRGDGDSSSPSSSSSVSVSLSPAQTVSAVAALQSGSPEARARALSALAASTGSDEPQLAALHGAGAIAALQKVLTGGVAQEQYQALWCLTNLASADHAATVLLYPALPYVVHLLDPANADLADQAAWCLGNIAGDCDECRARVMMNGVADPIVALLKMNNPPASLLQTLGFTICNLIRGRQFLGDFLHRGLLALVLRLLTPNQPVDVVVEMAWVLTFITAGPDQAKISMLKLGGADLLVQLLERSANHPLLLVPLLRIVGNLSSSLDAIVMQLVSTKNLLPYLWNHLGSSDTNVLKELTWALGSITGGPVQACSMLAAGGFVPPLAALFNSSVMAVRKEIGLVFLNMCSALRSTPFLPKLAATPGVMNSFVEFINLPDVDMIAMGLRWAAIVLKYLPDGKHIFESNGGLLALEDLEYNTYKNDELFSRANDLLERYFNDMHDEDEEEMTDTVQPSLPSPSAWGAGPPNQNFSF